MIEVGETLFTVGSRMLILVFLESQIVLESERFQLGERRAVWILIFILKGLLQIILTHRNYFFVIGYQRSRSRFESTLLSGGLWSPVREFPTSLLCSQGYAKECLQTQATGLIISNFNGVVLLNRLRWWQCWCYYNLTPCESSYGAHSKCPESGFSGWSVPLM